VEERILSRLADYFRRRLTLDNPGMEADRVNRLAMVLAGKETRSYDRERDREHLYRGFMDP
jgi:hypothetical protein